MKVVYDARWVPTDGHFDGVSRYSLELGLAMSKQPEINITWLVHDAKQLQFLPDAPHLIANRPTNLLAEWLSLRWRLRKLSPEVVYSPFFLITLAKSHRYKLIATIHDTIYFRYRTPPHWLSWYVRAGWWLFHVSKTPMRIILNRADAIATVSDTAKQELIEMHLTKHSITAVKNAVSDKFQKMTDQATNTRYASNIIVHHGAVTQYKNVELIIDAMKFLPGITFHMLGRVPEPRLRDLTTQIIKNNVQNQVVIHNGVTDEKLLEMLSICRCLICPSRIEGFGLPIIEAQLMGSPVACSDTPIFREIGGESVLFFDPDSPEQCADAIQKLANSELSASLIKAGQENASQYTWQKSAETASEICQNVAN